MIKDYLLIVDQLNKKFDEFKQLVNHEIEEIEALAKFPLTPQQESIMFYIIRHQPVKAKQIASYLNVSKSAISQVLPKLENQHLITREKNNENRRESLISLGSRGEEYAQLFCAEMIKKEYGNNRHITIALPNITFKEKIHLDLGDVSCRVEHVGGDHSHDSSVIFVEEEKVLFLGDCLYPHLYSEKPIYTVHNVLSLVEQLNKFDADTYVLSHELPLTKSQFQHYTRLLTLLCHCTKEKAGNRHEMIDALTTQLGRELNQSELAAVDCFANGVRA